MSRHIKRITKDIANFLAKYQNSEAIFDELSNSVSGKYNNVPFQIFITIDYPFKSPIFFINRVELTNKIEWIGSMNPFDIIVENITNFQQQTLTVPESIKRITMDIVDFLAKYHNTEATFDEQSNSVSGKYNNVSFQIRISTEYPVISPTFFINVFEFTNKIKWSSSMNPFDIIVEKITNLQQQTLTLPITHGFYSSSNERNFSSDDLHFNGYLYDCKNFNSKKYQFGSGFIYSIITIFREKVQLNISEQNIHEYIDILLDSPLFKELGCVYLVLKIYEEHLIYPLNIYVETLLQFVKSSDVKKQFNDRLTDFKRHYNDIISLSDRDDLLNMVLTIYVNIWLYSKIINGVVSNRLVDIIEQYMAIENTSDLYSISSAYIGGQSIQTFNSQLFLDNYNFVESMLRDNSGRVVYYIRDFFQIIKDFNNFSNDMINIDGRQIEISRKPGYRTKPFQNSANIYPNSLLSLETYEWSLCQDFSKILGRPISTIIEGSICEKITI
jgi:hypothetical protein